MDCHKSDYQNTSFAIHIYDSHLEGKIGSPYAENFQNIPMQIIAK